nr:cell division protein FtsA [Halolactibacillus miurensis]
MLVLANEVLVSLDIGTSQIKVVIGEIADERLNIIGVGTAKSKGIKKGGIVDIDKAVQSIRAAIESAERMVDMHIHSVIIGYNGNQVELLPCQGIVAVPNDDKEINDEDVLRVIDNAKVISYPPDREFLDLVIKQFIVDGLAGINDPRGMIGVRLEMEGTIITSSRTMIHNTTKCVERAQLDIQDQVLQPLAAGAIALSDDEKELGVALIDIGGGTTTVSIFDDGQLKGTRMIPIGGENITKDISYGLKTSFEEAEQIKIKHGYGYFPDANEEEQFEVKAIGTEEISTFNQKDLSDMIEARLEEVFVLVAKEISKLGYRDLPGGFVLTGGTMLMPGALELARDLYQGNVRVAVPDYIGVREPQYTPGVGILKFAYDNAKIQGKPLSDAVSDQAQYEERPVKKDKPKQSKPMKQKKPKDETKESGVAKLFKVFFD